MDQPTTPGSLQIKKSNHKNKINKETHLHNTRTSETNQRRTSSPPSETRKEGPSPSDYDDCG